jgi:hypothetical protein
LVLLIQKQYHDISRETIPGNFLGGIFDWGIMTKGVYIKSIDSGGAPGAIALDLQSKIGDLRS